MKSFNEWKSDKDMKTITIICRDPDDSLEELLFDIKRAGNVGHSFSILVDPESDEPRKHHWDGDGSDYIKEINVSKTRMH